MILYFADSECGLSYLHKTLLVSFSKDIKPVLFSYTYIHFKELAAKQTTQTLILFQPEVFPLEKGSIPESVQGCWKLNCFSFGVQFQGSWETSFFRGGVRKSPFLLPLGHAAPLRWCHTATLTWFNLPMWWKLFHFGKGTVSSFFAGYVNWWNLKRILMLMGTRTKISSREV